jgi:rod shape-determining protein MreC
MKLFWQRLIVIGILIITVILLPGKLGDAARGSGQKLLRPITFGLNNTAIWLETRYSNLANMGEMFDERTSLQNRVVELEQQVAGLSAVAHENELLRSELGVKTHINGWGRIQATVVSRLANNPSGEAIIDQGESAGIKVGQAVTAQGMLVGQVSKTTPSSATILLVTSSQSQVQAELADNQALGLITGSSTGLRLIEIDQGVSMSNGMIVQTSGITLGGTVPRGLVIGQIDRIVSEPSQTTQSAIIHSPIDFDRLRTVFIITPES